MLVFPPNFYVAVTLLPKLMVLGGVTFGTQLGLYEVMNESLPSEKSGESSVPLLCSPLFKGRTRRHQSTTGKGCPQSPAILAPCWWNSSSWTVRDKCLVYNTPNLWHFVTAAQTNRLQASGHKVLAHLWGSSRWQNSVKSVKAWHDAIAVGKLTASAPGPHVRWSSLSNPESSLLWTECCVSPNSNAETLIINMMVFGSRSFGR